MFTNFLFTKNAPKMAVFLRGLRAFWRFLLIAVQILTIGPGSYGRLIP